MHEIVNDLRKCLKNSELPILQTLVLRAHEKSAWAKYEFLLENWSVALPMAQKAAGLSRRALQMLDALKSNVDGGNPQLQHWYTNQRWMVCNAHFEAGWILLDVLEKCRIEMLCKYKWKDVSAELLNETSQCLILNASDTIKTGTQVFNIVVETPFPKMCPNDLRLQLIEETSTKIENAQNFHRRLASDGPSCQSRREFFQILSDGYESFGVRKNGKDLEFALSSCAFCQRSEETKGEFKKCKGCGEATYCSVDHQKKHWKTHKLHCAGCVNQGAPARPARPASTESARAGVAPEVMLEVAPEVAREVARGSTSGSPSGSPRGSTRGSVGGRATSLA